MNHYGTRQSFIHIKEENYNLNKHHMIKLKAA